LLIFQSQNGLAFAASLMIGVFPMLIGLLLVVPSTIFRTVSVFKNKLKQTGNEKIILAAGTIISRDNY
jgi:uncharacterized membrane protein